MRYVSSCEWYGEEFALSQSSLDLPQLNGRATAAAAVSSAVAPRSADSSIRHLHCHTFARSALCAAALCLCLLLLSTVSVSLSAHRAKHAVPARSCTLPYQQWAGDCQPATVLHCVRPCTVIALCGGPLPPVLPKLHSDRRSRCASQHCGPRCAIDDMLLWAASADLAFSAGTTRRADVQCSRRHITTSKQRMSACQTSGSVGM